MGKEETAIEKSQINVDFIKAEFPEVADALMVEGKKAEMKRIKGIEEKSMPGHENLISEMKFDGTTEPAQAAERILAAEQSKIKNLVKVEKVEAEKVPEVDSVSTDETTAKTEEAVNDMAAGIQARQGKIGGKK